MGMAKTEGIYLSVDYRVTEHPSGRLVDDVPITSRWWGQTEERGKI
jgi:hypothetical protein